MADAKRYNEGKPDLHYLHTWFSALCEVAQVCQRNAKPEGKYDRGNYLLGQPYSQLLAAAERHIGKFGSFRLPDRDEESGCHHLAHAIWNLLQLLELDLTETRKPKPSDDRLCPPVCEQSWSQPLKGPCLAGQVGKCMPPADEPLEAGESEGDDIEDLLTEAKWIEQMWHLREEVSWPGYRSPKEIDIVNRARALNHRMESNP